MSSPHKHAGQLRSHNQFPGYTFDEAQKPWSQRRLAWCAKIADAPGGLGMLVNAYYQYSTHRNNPAARDLSRLIREGFAHLSNDQILLPRKGSGRLLRLTEKGQALLGRRLEPASPRPWTHQRLPRMRVVDIHAQRAKAAPRW